MENVVELLTFGSFADKLLSFLAELLHKDLVCAVNVPSICFKFVGAHSLLTNGVGARVEHR